MIDRFFFDTNILAHLFDSDNPRKKEKAASLLAPFGIAGNANPAQIRKLSSVGNPHQGSMHGSDLMNFNTL